MTAYFGFLVTELSPETAKELGAPDGGLFVARVEQDSPAEFAGIIVGDVIVNVDGFPLPNLAALVARARNFESDRQVLLAVIRDEQSGTIPIIPAEAPEVLGGTLKAGLAGALLLDLDFGAPVALPKLFGGIQIVNVVAGSPAERSGLKTGDILTGINDIDISSLSEFLYVAKRSEEDVPLALIRGGAPLAIRLP